MNFVFNRINYLDFIYSFKNYSALTNDLTIIQVGVS